jgi:hypothetical protein
LANELRPSPPLHYLVAVDTDGIVRARRREQALEALEFERGRETALLAQIDEVLTELEGPRIDAAAFARMEAEDVELVRETLDPTSVTPEQEWLDLEGEPAAESARLRREEQEAERLRLGELVSECRRCQKALESYIQALDG